MSMQSAVGASYLPLFQVHESCAASQPSAGSPTAAYCPIDFLTNATFISDGTL